MNLDLLISLSIIPLLIAIVFTYGKLNARVDKLEGDVSDLRNETKESIRDLRNDLSHLQSRIESRINTLDEKFTQMLFTLLSQQKDIQSSQNLIKEDSIPYKSDNFK